MVIPLAEKKKIDVYDYLQKAVSDFHTKIKELKNPDGKDIKGKLEIEIPENLSK